MSFTAINWAWEQTCPSGVAKSVLVFLAKCASQEGGDCYPSIPLICKRVQHHDAAVRKAIRQLVEARLIEIQPRTAANGRQTSNLYRLPVVSVATPANSQGSPGDDYSPSWTAPTPAKSMGLDPREIAPPPPCEIEGVTPANSRGNPSVQRPIEPKQEQEENAAVALRAPSPVRLAAPALASVDVVGELYGEGLPILRGLVGRSDGACRKLLGQFRQRAGDDCAQVLAALHRAVDVRPIDPTAFILGILKAQPKRSTFDQIHHELGTTSLWAIDDDDPPLRLVAGGAS